MRVEYYDPLLNFLEFIVKVLTVAMNKVMVILMWMCGHSTCASIIMEGEGKKLHVRTVGRTFVG